METNNDLLKLSEKMGLCGLEDECIVLEDERADDIYGGKFVCGNYNVSGSAFIPCIIQKKQKQLIKLMLLLLFPSVRK